MIPFRVIPRHDQRGCPARTSAHGRATFRIFGQLNLTVTLDEGQHFRFDKLREFSRHRVILEPTLAPLRVTAAIRDHDRNYRGHSPLRDQVIQNMRKY